MDSQNADDRKLTADVNRFAGKSFLNYNIPMDMNDILSQWDKMQGKNPDGKSYDTPRQVSHKKANAPSALTKANKVSHETHGKSSSDKAMHENMEKWLEKYGVEDKDKTAKEKAQRKLEHSTNWAKLPIDDTLDLHGLTQDEAEKALETFIANAKRYGYRKVLIIHGKGIHSKDGNPVLAKLVRNFIERDKRCGASGHPKNSEGATGATWVVIK